MTTNVEHSEVHWGKTIIPYAIRRSSRRKTVAVAVFPTGSVAVTAPVGIGVRRLDRVVHQKARWINGRLRRVGSKARPTPSREFISGETFLYLGRQYRLRVTRGADGVSMERGRLVVHANESSPMHLRALLVRWYRERAGTRLADRVGHWAGRLGLEVPNVFVREQELRWGSCSPSGVLRFNWRVVQAPPALIDYVVAHELLHLRYPDHTKAFWSALGAVLPDADTRRAALREFGASVDW